MRTKASGLAMPAEAQSLYASYGNPGQVAGMAQMMTTMQMAPGMDAAQQAQMIQMMQMSAAQQAPMQAVPIVSAVAVPPGPEQMDRDNTSLAAQIERLEAMRKDGVLSDAEFQAAKSKTLGVPVV
mmetsp:Transcript_71641/g.142061  ORF Transcript_71641/g.142061 Transcript_71641/m.142061 type:complete len:125 (-) Transcript_71641:73-447(-)